MRQIDLNVDLAEGFAFDRALAKYASSANVCLGEHAGSRELSLETVAMLRENSVRIGAHPGYPDRVNMGRLAILPEHEHEFLTSIFAQMTWAVAAIQPSYLKPHGAFYNDTAMVLPENWRRTVIPPRGVPGFDPAAAFLARYPGMQSLSMLLRVHQLPLLGLPGTAHEELAARAGQAYIREGFVDRRYLPDGRLMPRSSPDAVLSDEKEIRDQVVRLLPSVDSLCLHGDTEGCVEIAALVTATLLEAGVEIRA